MLPSKLGKHSKHGIKHKIIKSLGKAEVFFISVASPVFSENPPKFHQKSQIYRTPLTGGLAKRSAKIKITPIPNSSLIPCFDMLFSGRNDRKKIILGWSGQKVKSRKEFIISQYKSVLVQVLIPAMGVISSDLLSPR